MNSSFVFFKMPQGYPAFSDRAITPLFRIPQLPRFLASLDHPFRTMTYIPWKHMKHFFETNVIGVVDVLTRISEHPEWLNS